jgi:hypothetical protein
MTNRTILIVGRGPSGYSFPYNEHMNVPILAVSGGYDAAPRMDHWVGTDKPQCFPKWLRDSEEIVKHVLGPRTHAETDMSFAAFWREYPKTRCWEYDEKATDPYFDYRAGKIAKGFPDRNHSLLFAVQVAAQMRYTDLVFVGVDFTDEELYPICDKLREWHPFAMRADISWRNASEISLLQEWMSRYEDASPAGCC